MPPPFIFLFWLSIFLNSLRFLSANPPASSTCTHDDAPRISHPFHLNLQQPRPSLTSYDVPSGFELLCTDNLTTIHFPSYTHYLVVKSISYPTKRINLLDPRNCVHDVFLNLDLSHTPFHYFYVLKNYTYLNCSKVLSRPFMEIPCMSGPDFHVYTVEPSLPVPGSCVTVKTIAIPFEYSPYLSDNSLGLGLTWDSPLLQETRTEHTAVNIGIFVIVAIAILVSVKVWWSRSRRDCGEKEDQLLQSL
ncbi:RING-H2 finger protein ATL22-like [Prosopis cineraria]|uniref:RING-H2 finger protein ATL22-like n=1 Tax=Prosopis cineraria TaxID=364024 RepID=UPI00240F3FBF|nr:RING-H2 finger protein ATL22-like [Prosopis cineraria]